MLTTLDGSNYRIKLYYMYYNKFYEEENKLF